MSVILVGGGGQCRSSLPIIMSLIKAEDIAGIVDGDQHLGKSCFGVEFKYTDEQLEELADGNQFIITIGQTPVQNPTGRKRMYKCLSSMGADILTIQSRCAIVHGALCPGVMVHDMAYIGPCSEVGDGTIINTGAIVEHDVRIGKHCHICPGAVVLGGVTICDDVIIGAGSVVVASITQSGFYAGAPARPIMLDGPQIIKPDIMPGGMKLV